MELVATINNKSYAAQLEHVHDISIAVRFDDKALTAFGAALPHHQPFKAGDFIGDVKKGGSCNCELLTFSPHLHGTHTECVGHISEATIYVSDVLTDSFIPATLVTIAPEKQSDDWVITLPVLQHAMKTCMGPFLEALIIRTLPNSIDKKAKQYGREMPPYFSGEAMEYINHVGVKHLLVDMPSIDRMEDNGKLANHRIFWGVAQGNHSIDKKTASRKTVTELVYVQDEIPDGNYLLNLQIAAFASDASPSRPLLYPVKTL